MQILIHFEFTSGTSEPNTVSKNEKLIVLTAQSSKSINIQMSQQFHSTTFKPYHIPDSSLSQSSVWPFTSSWPKFYNYSLSSSLCNLLCLNILTILGHLCNSLSSILCDILTANFILYMHKCFKWAFFFSDTTFNYFKHINLLKPTGYMIHQQV
jgi:hypothetical protein